MSPYILCRQPEHKKNAAAAESSRRIQTIFYRPVIHVTGRWVWGFFQPMVGAWLVNFCSAWLTFWAGACST